jgi:tetratricopeptide (TPR) repeat protein
VTWINITCDDAHLPDELIATYQAFGSRLAALPPCGECGDLTAGCLGGGACTRANLAAGAAWAPFDVDFDTGEIEDPELVERRARGVLPLLAGERDLAPYVRLGAELGGRLVAWGRVEDALAVWHEVVAGCAGRDVPNLVDQTDRFAEALAAAKRYADAAVVAEPAFQAARQQARPEPLWRIADHLASHLERAGRLEQAMGLWREAIDGGSNVPRTFDRLSLALDRAGNPGAAAEVCETGLARSPTRRDVTSSSSRSRNAHNAAAPRPALRMTGRSSAAR